MTIIILTRDEEANIRRCIESVKGQAKRIVVVDSGSTDKTVDIAKTVWGGANYELKNYSLEFRVNGAAASFVYGRMAA